MAGRIHVNHIAVLSKTAAIRSRLQARLADMESRYGQVQSTLNNVDGAANAAFMAEIERNKRKAYAAAEVADKLLRFLQGSAHQMRIEDSHMSNMFGIIKPPPKGGLQ